MKHTTSRCKWKLQSKERAELKPFLAVLSSYERESYIALACKRGLEGERIKILSPKYNLRDTINCTVELFATSFCGIFRMICHQILQLVVLYFLSL